MQAGDCFVFTSGRDGHHLWVVISDPIKDTEQVLIVNLTSVRGTHFDDLSCVFEANEHPWITKQSCIAFDMAEVHADAYLDRQEKARSIELWPAFPLHLLTRIRQAATVTENLAGDCLQLLVDQGLV